MSQLAVGIIETIGLAACIEAADACVKSANVNLIGYELSKGGGMAVLKIEGNVGAVKAAVDAGIVAANRVNKVFSYKVIPRPSEKIENLIRSNDTVGYIDEAVDMIEEASIEETVLEPTQVNDEEANFEQFENIEEASVNEIQEVENNTENIEERDLNIENTIDNNQHEESHYTCNICKDPKCSRQKGELKTNCIHYNEFNDN